MLLDYTFSCADIMDILFITPTQSTNNQSVDKTVCMQRLVCAAIVCISKQRFFHDVANIKYSVTNKIRLRVCKKTDLQLCCLYKQAVGVLLISRAEKTRLICAFDCISKHLIFS